MPAPAVRDLAVSTLAVSTLLGQPSLEEAASRGVGTLEGASGPALPPERVIVVPRDWACTRAVPSGMVTCVR